MKIWDSTRIYNSDRISGGYWQGYKIIEPVTWVPLRPIKLGPSDNLVEIRVHVVYRCCNMYRTPPVPWDLATYI
jgi:hypothetical protein